MFIKKCKCCDDSCSQFDLEKCDLKLISTGSLGRPAPDVQGGGVGQPEVGGAESIGWRKYRIPDNFIGKPWSIYVRSIWENKTDVPIVQDLSADIGNTFPSRYQDEEGRDLWSWSSFPSKLPSVGLRNYAQFPSLQNTIFTVRFDNHDYQYPKLPNVDESVVTIFAVSGSVEVGNFIGRNRVQIDPNSLCEIRLRTEDGLIKEKIFSFKRPSTAGEITAGFLLATDPYQREFTLINFGTEALDNRLSARVIITGTIDQSEAEEIVLFDNNYDRSGQIKFFKPKYITNLRAKIISKDNTIAEIRNISCPCQGCSNVVNPDYADNSIVTVELDGKDEYGFIGSRGNHVWRRRVWRDPYPFQLNPVAGDFVRDGLLPTIDPRTRPGAGFLSCMTDFQYYLDRYFYTGKGLVRENDIDVELVKDEFILRPLSENERAPFPLFEFDRPSLYNNEYYDPDSVETVIQRVTKPNTIFPDDPCRRTTSSPLTDYYYHRIRRVSPPELITDGLELYRITRFGVAGPLGIYREKYEYLGKVEFPLSVYSFNGSALKGTYQLTQDEDNPTIYRYIFPNSYPTCYCDSGPFKIEADLCRCRVTFTGPIVASFDWGLNVNGEIGNSCDNEIDLGEYIYKGTTRIDISRTFFINGFNRDSSGLLFNFGINRNLYDGETDPYRRSFKLVDDKPRNFQYDYLPFYFTLYEGLSFDCSSVDFTECPLLRDGNRYTLGLPIMCGQVDPIERIGFDDSPEITRFLRKAMNISDGNGPYTTKQIYNSSNPFNFDFFGYPRSYIAYTELYNFTLGENYLFIKRIDINNES